MVIVMAAFWGGLIWLAIAFIRRDRREYPPAGPHTAVPVGVPQPRQDPAEILAERLARGEIEPDDYRRRLEALQGSRGE
jgi:putative membrane protein